MASAFDLSTNNSGKGRTRPDLALAEVARRQRGVVSAAQLRRLGIDRRAVEYRVSIGRLHPVHRGVYAVGHRHLTTEATFVAAVLAVGDGAVLSHLSAAVLWGFVKPRPGMWVHVTTTRRVKQRRGIRLHIVRDLSTADQTRRQAIALTTPIRTVLDLAAILEARALTRAVHEAQVQRLLDHAELLARVDTERGRPGVRRLAAILAPGPARTRSGLEDRFLELLAARGLPRPKTNVELADVPGRPEVDMLFPEARLVVEVDSDRYHGTLQRRRLDAAKQARIEAHAYRVERADEDDLPNAAERIAGALV